MIFFDSIYFGDFMFIDFNELKRFVTDGLNMYKDGGIKAFINYLKSCTFFNNIISLINISEELEDNGIIKYNLCFCDNYIGTMVSQLSYNTKKENTKYSILKYLLLTNKITIFNFLYSLLDINNAIIKKENNLDLVVKSKLIFKGNNIDSLSDDINRVDCKLAYSVYNKETLIGLFNLNCYGYLTNDNIDRANLLEKNIVTKDDSDKKFLLRKMKQYNQYYIKRLQA